MWARRAVGDAVVVGRFPLCAHEPAVRVATSEVGEGTAVGDVAPPAAGAVLGHHDTWRGRGRGGRIKTSGRRSPVTSAADTGRCARAWRRVAAGWTGAPRAGPRDATTVNRPPAYARTSAGPPFGEKEKAATATASSSSSTGAERAPPTARPVCSRPGPPWCAGGPERTLSRPRSPRPPPSTAPWRPGEEQPGTRRARGGGHQRPTTVLRAPAPLAPATVQRATTTARAATTSRCTTVAPSGRRRSPRQSALRGSPTVTPVSHHRCARPVPGGAAWGAAPGGLPADRARGRRRRPGPADRPGRLRTRRGRRRAGTPPMDGSEHPAPPRSGASGRGERVALGRCPCAV